jgi:hypothetical protein
VPKCVACLARRRRPQQSGAYDDRGCSWWDHWRHSDDDICEELRVCRPTEACCTTVAHARTNPRRAVRGDSARTHGVRVISPPPGFPSVEEFSGCLPVRSSAFTGSEVYASLPRKRTPLTARRRSSALPAWSTVVTSCKIKRTCLPPDIARSQNPSTTPMELLESRPSILRTVHDRPSVLLTSNMAYRLPMCCCTL